MNYSASDLTKKSASQIAYLYLKKIERFANKNQIKGNKHAKEIIKKDNASEERRGIIKLSDDLLFFCIDYVKDNLFVEIKNIEGQYEDWYLNCSILQSAYYATLLTKVNHLDTPVFRKKEGYKQEITKIPNKWQYQLWFGNIKFNVFPKNEIYEFYNKKIEVINKTLELNDFKYVRDFDSKYKFKEFDILKPKFIKL